MPYFYLKTGAQQEIWWSKLFSQLQRLEPQHYFYKDLSFGGAELSRKTPLLVTAIKCVFIDFITCDLVFHYLHSAS